MIDRRILGAVLAGGEAKRFGSDKALALFEGRPLIDHVATALALQTEKIVVIGRRHGNLTSVADRPRAGLGPLGALAGALHHAWAAGYTAVLSAPCDAPLLPLDLPAQVAGQGAAYVEGLPVIGLWPSELSLHLDQWLSEDRPRAVRRWATAVGARAVTLDMLPPNVNTLADLSALRR